MLEAPRGLSHPQTSFIGTVCQGIHHTPFRAAHAPKNPNDSFKRQTTNHHTVKNDHKTIDLETRLQKRAWRNRDKANDDITSSHCSRPLSSSQTTTHPDRTRPAARKADGVPPGASGKPHAPKTDAGGGPGTQKHTHTTPRRPPREPAKPTISSTPARPHEPETIPGAWATRRTPDRRPQKKTP